MKDKIKRKLAKLLERIKIKKKQKGYSLPTQEDEDRSKKVFPY